jgi:uncharacterized protein DUF6176
MIKLTITKARKEVVEKYINWGKELMSVRLSEAVDSLKREKLQGESAFLLDIEGQLYIAHVSEFEETPLPADMSIELNKEHRMKNREVMDPSVRAEGKLIYDIKAD